MTSSAADELNEALTRLHNDRDVILSEVAGIERDLAEKHEALADLNEKIDAMQKTLAVLRPELARELQPPAPPEEDEEEATTTPAARAPQPRQTAPTASPATGSSRPPCTPSPPGAGTSPSRSPTTHP